MKPWAFRSAYLMRYLRTPPYKGCSFKQTLDVLNADFVDRYIDDCEITRFKASILGAHFCPVLGEDLARLYREGKLERWATGVGNGYCHMGFPRWVYTYRIRNDTRLPSA